MSKFFNLRSVSLIAFAFLSCLTSCSKTDISADEIIGSWYEVEPAEILQFAGTSHDFTFNEDGSFLLTKILWTDDISVGAPCPGNRMDYIKGDFSLSNEVLSLEGSYTDAVFDSIQSNCEGTATFNQSYNYEFAGEILLLNPEGELYQQIRLIR